MASYDPAIANKKPLQIDIASGYLLKNVLECFLFYTLRMLREKTCT